MNLEGIAIARLRSQQVAGTEFKTVKDIVGWMGAMQAQDYAMAKWAIGVRLPDSTDHMIESAIDKGEIIRTHLLRPTWHFVSPKDIHWMVELTAPRIRAILKSLHKQLEISPAIIRKSNAVIEKALKGTKHLTREELVNELTRNKIPTNDTRAANLIIEAELGKIICSGMPKNKKQTYALLCERAPSSKPLLKKEALEKLAKRYFTSHCPATLQDFKWWSGLSYIDAKEALESVKTSFTSEVIGSQEFWFTNSFQTPGNTKTIKLLPAFDEFLIGYADRSASLSFEDYKEIGTNNGIFYPSVTRRGKVIGRWKREMKKEVAIVNVTFFHPQSKTVKNDVKKEAKRFGRFLGKKIDVNYIGNEKH